MVYLGSDLRDKELESTTEEVRANAKAVTESEWS